MGVPATGAFVQQSRVGYAENGPTVKISKDRRKKKVSLRTYIEGGA
jgi:hypothetical protein